MSLIVGTFVPVHRHSVANRLRVAFNTREANFILRLRWHGMDVILLRSRSRWSVRIRFERDYLEGNAKHL